MLQETHPFAVAHARRTSPAGGLSVAGWCALGSTGLGGGQLRPMAATSASEACPNDLPRKYRFLPTEASP